MANLNLTLEKLQNIADDPKIMFNKYLGEGKKVIGCFPIYTPGELVHAAGMIPYGLWGGQVNPALAGQYAPVFICSIMRSCLEYGMLGAFKGMSAVIMPILCDTFRGMSGAWRVGVKDIPLIGFIQPQNRTNKDAKKYMAAEYEVVKEKLEAIAGIKITEAALAASINLYNEHSACMMEFAQVANDHLDIITPKVRHAVMKSALLMEKSEHLALVKDVLAGLKELPKHEWSGKKVVLTGITAEPNEMLDILAENGIAVVGDDLAQESRQYRTPVPTGSTGLEQLAQQWQDRTGCATVYEVHNTRAEQIVQMVKSTNADGVIVCLMSFCDVEEYEYPMLANAFDKAGIRNLCINIDQSSEGAGQYRTKVQSFVETM